MQFHRNEPAHPRTDVPCCAVLLHAAGPAGYPATRSYTRWTPTARTPVSPHLRPMRTSTDVGQDAHMYTHAAGAAGDTRPRRMDLQLEIDESFLRLIGFMRARLTHAPAAARGGAAEHDAGFFAREERRQLDQLFEVKRGLGRLTRLLPRTLQLGERTIARTDEVDIVVKFLYKNLKKIVFQLCQNEEFMKIDILWSNILTMHACFDDKRFDTLTIKVRSSSERYRAMRPPAMRFRQWQQCEDYTTRTFYLEFEKGILERSYGKMLYTDPSLIPLSLSPPCQDEDEGAAQEINTQQVLTQQNRMSTPLASLPSFVQGATPSTMMMSSTNTGTNFTTHSYSSLHPLCG